MGKQTYIQSVILIQNSLFVYPCYSRSHSILMHIILEYCNHKPSAFKSEFNNVVLNQ